MCQKKPEKEKENYLFMMKNAKKNKKEKLIIKRKTTIYL